MLLHPVPPYLLSSSATSGGRNAPWILTDLPQVDLRKVNISVLRPWIAEKVTELIKIEDDVVVEYVFGMLEDRDTPVSHISTPLIHHSSA